MGSNPIGGIISLLSFGGDFFIWPFHTHQGYPRPKHGFESHWGHNIPTKLWWGFFYLALSIPPGVPKVKTWVQIPLGAHPPN